MRRLISGCEFKSRSMALEEFEIKIRQIAQFRGEVQNRAKLACPYQTRRYRRLRIANWRLELDNSTHFRPFAFSQIAILHTWSDMNFMNTSNHHYTNIKKKITDKRMRNCPYDIETNAVSQAAAFMLIRNSVPQFSFARNHCSGSRGNENKKRLITAERFARQSI